MDGASSKNFKKTKTPEEVKEALKHFVGTDPEVYVSVGQVLLPRKQNHQVLSAGFWVKSNSCYTSSFQLFWTSRQKRKFIRYLHV